MTKLFLLSAAQSIAQMIAQIEARQDLWTTILWLTVWWLFGYAVFYIIIHMKLEYYKAICQIRHSETIIMFGAIVCIIMFFVALGKWTYWLDVDYNLAKYYFG